MRGWRLLFWVLLGLSSCVSAKWVTGKLQTNSDWSFLTRFCFLSKDGKFYFTFKLPQAYGIQQLLLYYDEPGQWESVYKSDKNCSERVSVLSKTLNQIIDLTNRSTSSRPAGCEAYTQDGESHFNCTETVDFRSGRERWWYIAAAHCDPKTGEKHGLHLEYIMHLVNGLPGDFLHYELSADEFYIPSIDIAFLIAYLILLVVSLVCAVVLFNRQMLHTTYRLYVTSLFLWLLGLLLQCIAWGRYSSTGWKESSTEVAGRLLLAGSTVVFILMLMLMAKGYTITRGRLTHRTTVRLFIFFFAYIIVNIILFIWEGAVFDEGHVLYFYESVPGYGLVTMRLVGWLWLLYAAFFTLKHHPSKSPFYFPFVIFYTVWFWAGPVVILAAIFAMPKWSREKTVNGVEQFVAFCGHLFFLVLTHPSVANTNFPYHLRVSQVRFSDDDGGDPGDTYALSEISRRHLDSLFVVQNNGTQGHTTSAHPTENGGYLNRGYRGEGRVDNGYMRSENGYTPSLESTFTIQNTHTIPPLSTITPLPPSQNGLSLPPLRNRPVLPSLSATQNENDVGTTNRLPPLHDGEVVSPESGTASDMKED